MEGTEKNNDSSYDFYDRGGGLLETKDQYDQRMALKENEEKEKLVGFGGWLVIFAGWLITLPLLLLSSISTLSQMKIAMILGNDFFLPDEFFEYAKNGYYALLALSAIMIFAFFKKKKYYILLEIINLIARVALLTVLVRIMGDVQIIFSELADFLTLSVGCSLITIIYFIFSKRVKKTFTN